MTDTFRQECTEAILAFAKSFKNMKLPTANYPYAYQLIEKVQKEVQNPKLNGAAFGLAIRSFFDYFSRELLPGGIVLSDQAHADWDRVREVANSTELLRTTNSAIGFGF